MVSTIVLIKLYFNNKKRIFKQKTLQNPTVKYALPLIEKEHLSHDTRRLRFGLPQDHCLGKFFFFFFIL